MFPRFLTCLLLRVLPILVFASLPSNGQQTPGVSSYPVPKGDDDASARRASIAAQREAGAQFKIRLQQALTQRASRLVVPPGIYRLSPDLPDAPHILLQGISNFELIADGVTFICETKNSALVLQHCDHIKIQGVTIDYDPLPMTQGTIIAVGLRNLDFTMMPATTLRTMTGKASLRFGSPMAPRTR